VPGDVFASFQNAVSVAKANGYDLSITDVVVEAMKMSVKHARKQFGESAFQTELQLSDVKPAVKEPVKNAVGNTDSKAVEPTKSTTTLSVPGKAQEPAKK
jgi:hypothetical protein